MKSELAKPILRNLHLLFLLAGLILSFSVISCKDDDNSSPDASYRQVNLVANVSEYNAAHVDTNLVNAWGMAIGPTGSFWISSTEKDKTVVYDRTGMSIISPIQMEGEPTGVVYNSSTVDFMIPLTTLVSKYIYVGEEGVVSAWSVGPITIEIANNFSDGAVYKGVAIAQDEGSNFLYIANFSEAEIEVLNKDFVYIESKPFEDPTMPAGFAPFNVANIDGKLYVTYAKQSADKYDDVSGAGYGYVNVFNPDGTLIKRFASQGTLNAPWGIAKAPDGFAQGSGAILVGNFGDGRINVFSADGEYMGQLKDGNTTISIEGLWALAFPPSGTLAGDENTLFFTAGPDDETHGLFGFLELR